MTALSILTLLTFVESNTQQVFHVGPVRASEERVDIPLRLPKGTLAKLDPKIRNNRIVFFLPKVKEPPRSLQFRKGPLRSFKVTEARRGSVVTLMVRRGTRISPNEIIVRSGNRATIVLSSKMDQESVAVSQTLPAATPSRAAPAQAFASAPETGTETSRSFPTAAVLVVFCLVAVGAWWLKHKRKTDRPPHAIDLVAARPVSAKQRLVVVDTCGERFLLAASDKDLRLLSRLDSDRVSESDFAQALQTHSAEAGSTDVAGLIRLRDGRKTTTQVAA